MKIVHYLPDCDLARGGIVRAVLDLASTMAVRGHLVTVLVAGGDDVPADWDGGAGRPRSVAVKRGRMGFFGPAARRRLAASIEQADVLHLHNLWNPELMQLRRMASQARCPYIVTTHGVLDLWSLAQGRAKKRLYLRLTARRLLDEASAVHCTAAVEREQAAHSFSNSAIAVIPYLVDLHDYAQIVRPAEPDDRGVPVVLFMSRLHMKKGIEPLLEAMVVMAGRGEKPRLVLAGAGDPVYVSSIRKRLQRLGLSDRVELAGHVDGSRKLDLLRRASLFVLPTQQENFGIVLAEALAAGVPVLTTRGTDLWREIEATGGAVVLNLNDAASAPAALADAIANLLGDPNRRAEMARCGRGGVAKWLDPERIASDFEALYGRCARSMS